MIKFEDEGVITGFEDPRVPEGQCAVYLNGELLYVGPLDGSIVRDGARVYINPADFHRLSAWYKKKLH